MRSTMFKSKDGRRIIPSTWDDLRFPLIGRNLDSSSGRIDYDFDEIAVGFQPNARFRPLEGIHFVIQFPHGWEYGSRISPHLHWMQQGDETPNWMLRYRWYDNNDQIPAGFTNVAMDFNAYPKIPGEDRLAQISEFTIPTPEGVANVSSILEVSLFRDSENTSGLFAGVDTSLITEIAKEFDVHILSDQTGSFKEYVKD